MPRSASGRVPPPLTYSGPSMTEFREGRASDYSRIRNVIVDSLPGIVLNYSAHMLTETSNTNKQRFLTIFRNCYRASLSRSESIAIKRHILAEPSWRALHFQQYRRVLDMSLGWFYYCFSSPVCTPAWRDFVVRKTGNVF